MNKYEFIKDLQKRLRKLPQTDIDNALNYYVEYFEDANTPDHENVTQLFGHPSSIASDILADYAVNHPMQVKTKTSSIWFVILAILAAPIGLPLGLALIILLCVPLIVIAAIAFALFVTAGALIFSGGAIMLASFFIMTTCIPTTLLFFGSGCLIVGVGLLFLTFIMWLTRLSINGLAKLFRLALTKLNKRHILGGKKDE